MPRYAALVPPARPSSPSVRFTQFTVAVKMKMTSGIIPQSILTEMLVNGILISVIALK